MADLTEREALLLFVEKMRGAEAAARSIAHLRLDLRWVKVASHLADVQQRCAALISQKAA